MAKQHIVDEIVTCIEKGDGYTQTMAVNGSKWQLRERTFNRYWKLAKDQHLEKQQSIKTATLSVDIQNAVQQRIGQIADINERKEVLTQILRGEIPLTKPMVCGKMIEFVDVVPDWMDRKNAIAELNKMEGSYEAQKIDIVTDRPATTIKSPDGTIITL